MSYALDVSEAEQIELPNGGKVEIPIARLKLKPSNFPNIWGYGKKPIVEVNGKSVFAEIAILEMLRNNGWEGYWLDSWRGRCRADMPGAHASSFDLSALTAIPALQPYLAGFREYGGMWDLLAWKDSQVVFCDAKWSKKDYLKPNQIEWMQARLGEGADPDDFLIAEWVLDVPVAVDSKIAGSHKMKLRQGKWYGWHMFPGYVGYPYASPIKMKSIGPAEGSDKLRIGFRNVGYAHGVQDFVLDLKIINWNDEFIAVEIASSPERLALITEINSSWLVNCFPQFEKRYPRVVDADTEKKLSAFLDQAFGEG